jgi:hypothetical protein
MEECKTRLRQLRQWLRQPMKPQPGNDNGHNEAAPGNEDGAYLIPPDGSSNDGSMEVKQCKACEGNNTVALLSLWFIIIYKSG